MQEFLQKIKSSTNLGLGSLVKMINKDPTLCNFIINQTSFLQKNVDLPFRLFHIREGLTEQIKCKNCNSFLYKIRTTFCNKKCSAIFNGSQTNIQLKKSKSLIKSHSLMTVEKKADIQRKREQTNLSKGGHISNLHSTSGKEKTKQTFIKKYEADRPAKNNLIKEKISYKNKLKSKAASAIRKETCLNKYGVNNVMHIPEVKRKIKDTCILKYGYESPMQNEEFLNKFFKESHRKFQAKPYILPSGNIVNLLGYEPMLLDYLLTKFNEFEITIGYDVYLKIRCNYVQSSKQHRYIPDFYIEKRNLVIEVKSRYTYNYANPNKRKSVQEKGINFIYAIVDTNKIKFKRYENSKS